MQTRTRKNARETRKEKEKPIVTLKQVTKKTRKIVTGTHSKNQAVRPKNREDIVRVRK